MLHPNLNINFKIKPSNWIPGMRTEFKNILKNRNIVESGVKRARSAAMPIKTKKALLEKSLKDLEYARSRPMIRCSSAYIDKHKQRMIEDKLKMKNTLEKKNSYNRKTKKLELVPVDFVVPLKKNSGKYFSQVEFSRDHLDDYLPVSEFKFRRRDRSKWIEKSGFKLS